MTAIANGAVGGAAIAIENAMSLALPVAIGFMASLLGLGGITDKIQDIIKRVRQPIEKAIDWVIAKAVKFAKKIGGKFKTSKFGQKLKAGKEKLQDWKEGGKQKLQDWKDRGKPDRRTEKEKLADLRAALKEAEKLGDNDELSLKEVKKRIQKIKNKYRMQYLELVVDKHTKDGDVIHFEGKINPDGKSEQVVNKNEDDENRFDRLLYEALKQLGAKHYKGYTKSEYSTIDRYNAQEANLRSQRPGAQERVEGADIRSQRPKSQEQAVDLHKGIAQDKEVISQLQSEKKKEIELLANKIHQQLARAQIAYSTASMAKYYPNNLFKVGSGRFFVEQAINYYIAPADEVGEEYDYYDINGLNKSPKEYIPVPKKNGIPQQSEGFKLGSKNQVGTKYAYKKLELGLAKKKLEQFPESITSDEGSTIFLAATLTEPSRYSVSHITNLLVLSNPNLDDSLNVFTKFSMTQSHSDPTGGAREAQARATTRLEELKKNYPQVEDLLQPGISKKAKSKQRKNLIEGGITEKTIQDIEGLSSAVERLQTDERIEHEGRPKIVTDRDLAAVKENTQLMGQLKKAFENHENVEDSQLIETFKQLISKQLQLE